MTRPGNVLIVIFDGEHARYVRASAAHVLHTERVFDSVSAHRRASELASDRPGASFHSDSSAHHAIAPRHDAHRLALDHFARFVAAEVNAMAEGAFDSLVIAAPRRSLTPMLQQLDTRAEAKLGGVVSKDLMKVPDDALWPHLKDFLPPPDPPRRS